MNTNLELEQGLKGLMTLIGVAMLVASAYFAINLKYNLAIYYMSGAVLMTQFVVLYSVTISQRRSVAAVNLLKEELDTGDEDNDADE